MYCDAVSLHISQQLKAFTFRNFTK